MLSRVPGCVSSRANCKLITDGEKTCFATGCGKDGVCGGHNQPLLQEKSQGQAQKSSEPRELAVVTGFPTWVCLKINCRDAEALCTICVYSGNQVRRIYPPTSEIIELDVCILATNPTDLQTALNKPRSRAADESGGNLLVTIPKRMSNHRIRFYFVLWTSSSQGDKFINRDLSEHETKPHLPAEDAPLMHGSLPFLPSSPNFLLAHYDDKVTESVCMEQHSVVVVMSSYPRSTSLPWTFCHRACSGATLYLEALTPSESEENRRQILMMMSGDM